MAHRRETAVQAKLMALSLARHQVVSQLRIPTARPPLLA
jgi:hypothetical protein